MDLFTMVITMCISGQPACTSSNLSRPEFTSAEVCEDNIDAVTNARTKELAKNPALKGKTVTYNITCFSHTQLVKVFGDQRDI